MRRCFPAIAVPRGRDEDEMATARGQATAELGEPGAMRAIAVAANFEMMNRVAEGTGIPVPGAAIERESEMVHVLGLNDFYKH